MISLWDFLCEHMSIHLLKKNTLVQALADAGVYCLWGVGASSASPLTSLFPSSGNSSKKPTREWEPLSEPKVMPVCLPVPSPPLCWGLGRASAEHEGISARQMCLQPELLCLAHRGLLGLQRGASRGLGPVVCHACGLGCGAWRSTRNAC